MTNGRGRSSRGSCGMTIARPSASSCAGTSALVRGFLRRMLRASDAFADDLAQETFHQGISLAGGLPRRAPRFPPGCVRSPRTSCAPSGGASKRRAEFLEEEWSMQSAPVSVAGAESGTAGRDLAAALTRLPETQRAALVLCFEHGLTHEEAAAVLQLSRRHAEIPRRARQVTPARCCSNSGRDTCPCTKVTTSIERRLREQALRPSDEGFTRRVLAALAAARATDASRVCSRSFARIDPRRGWRWSVVVAAERWLPVPGPAERSR